MKARSSSTVLSLSYFSRRRLSISRLYFLIFSSSLFFSNSLSRSSCFTLWSVFPSANSIELVEFFYFRMSLKKDCFLISSRFYRSWFAHCSDLNNYSLSFWFSASSNAELELSICCLNNLSCSSSFWHSRRA